MKKIRTRTSLAITGATVGIAGLVMAVAIPIAAKADPTQVIVTPANTQGWSTADTRPGGAVNFVADNTAPGNPNNGALQLTTDLTTTAKAQYLHAANTSLSDVTNLSYYTKQNSPAGPIADPSYQVITYLNGGTSGFSTLVYEPYQNPTQGTVTNGIWQQWDVGQGLFWSTRTVTCSNGTVNGTPGGPATYTLSAITALCPDALVAGFGVNIGTNNPGYNVETDLFNFNGTTYNFEPFIAATDKNQCKGGGWQTVTDNSGNHFKNQGDCVSYIATNGKNPANG